MKQTIITTIEAADAFKCEAVIPALKQAIVDAVAKMYSEGNKNCDDLRIKVQVFQHDSEEFDI